MIPKSKLTEICKEACKEGCAVPAFYTETGSDVICCRKPGGTCPYQGQEARVVPAYSMRKLQSLALVRPECTVGQKLLQEYAAKLDDSE